MWKPYEIFKFLKVRKRIVSGEAIRGNTVCESSVGWTDWVVFVITENVCNFAKLSYL